MYQTLSLEFIHDFADKVDWDLITLYQNVPEDFLTSHIDYMEPSENELLLEHSDDNETDTDSDAFDYPSSIHDSDYETDSEYDTDFECSFDDNV